MPLRLYIDDRGRAKVELGVARGKQLHDRRRDIADRDARRDMAARARRRPARTTVSPAEPAARGLRCSAPVDERLHLTDESLQRLDVIRRRLLGDGRPEAKLDIGPKSLGDLLGRAVPERIVVGDPLHGRPVVLHGRPPDAIGFLG